MEVDYNQNPTQITQDEDHQDDLMLKRRLDSNSRSMCYRNFGITVEPVFILHGMAYSIISIVGQNFYIDRICRISENIEDVICQNLTQNPLEEKLIESVASKYYMYQSLIENGFPILMALFLGPWTDKYGNKSILMLSLSGYIISSTLYIISFYFPQLPPEYILICSIPLAMTGGVVTFIITTFSLVTKNSETVNRSFRFTLVGLSWDFGSLIGCLVGAKIFYYGGFLTVFVFGLFFYSLAFIYTAVAITEEKPDQFVLLNNHISNQMCSLFDVAVIKEMLNTCFKRRQGQIRRWILISIFGISLQNLAWNSKPCSLYLFTRNKFGWDTEIYSDYSAVNTLVGSIGGALMMLIFIKLLRLSDLFVLAINCISNLSAYCLFAFANAGWQMYLGSVIQMFGTITTSLFRSVLSKCVFKDEYGRLFSFVTCVEQSMLFVSGPLYGLVYMKTELIFPGAVFLISAGLTFIILFSLLFLRNSVNYVFLEDDDE